MLLEQAIVIVNEYTVKSPETGKGSRGSTPGNYILGYMARKGSVEDLTPVRFDAEDYVLRYSARKDATERVSSPMALKPELRKIQGRGGIAFSAGDVSLSDRKLRDITNDIQTQYDKGKTIMKTVLSFDTEYLREMGVVDKDFDYTGRGCFRGQIDQMKLRLGIMNGMRSLGGLYDDLNYVGVVQVDTGHVHCHLTMVDKGVGRIVRMSDENDFQAGTQKGKLSKNAKTRIRRGVDNFLLSRNVQNTKHYCNDVTKDRANVKAFVKKCAYAEIGKRGGLQTIMALLPDDRRDWRASKNSAPMRNANAAARSYVEDVFKEPDSGYDAAITEIRTYWDNRAKKEKITDGQYRKAIERDRKVLVDGCVNKLYSVLKEIPKHEFRVRTSALDAATVDFETLKESKRDDPMLEFAFHLRTYGGRLNHHKDEVTKYAEAVESFDKQEEEHGVDPSALVLREFYKEEEEYNRKLMAKYQRFLRFMPPPVWLVGELANLKSEKDKLKALEGLIADEDLSSYNSHEAEAIGLERYGIVGGGLIPDSRPVLDIRAYSQKLQTEEHENQLVDRLSFEGFVLEGDNARRGESFDFEEVKGLDLHHLEYDFTFDVEVPQKHIDLFAEQANRRYTALDRAAEYLVSTGQSEQLKEFPLKDVEVMKAMADRLTGDPMLLSQSRDIALQAEASTVTLDESYDTQVKEIIVASLKNEIVEV